jgi:hypothetical protein
MPGIRDQDLHRDRAEPDQQAGDQERQRMGRKRRRQQRQRAEARHAHDQTPVLDEIAERHDQQQSRAVAELGHGHDQAGRLSRQPQIRGDRTDQRLRIIEIGDDQPAGHREQRGQPSRERLGRARQFRSNRGHARSPCIRECSFPR